MSIQSIHGIPQTISNLKKVLRNKIFENKALKTDLIGAEKELKILLEKNIQMEIEKNNMTQIHKKEINYLEKENEKLNNLLVEELGKTRDKFDQIYKDFSNDYSELMKEMDSKCKVPPVVNKYIDNSDHSDHSDHSVTHHHHKVCSIF